MGIESGSPNVSGASLRLAQAYGVVPPRASGVGAAAFRGALQDPEGVNAPSVGPGTTQSRAREVVDTVSLAAAPNSRGVDPAKVAELRAEVGRTLSAAKLDVGIEPSTGMPVARVDVGAGNAPSGTLREFSGFASPARVQGVLPRTPAAVFAMYQKPADQNVAATGVALGRQLDLNG